MLEKMTAGLLAIPGLKLYGITDPRRFDNRCATIVVMRSSAKWISSPGARR